MLAPEITLERKQADFMQLRNNFLFQFPILWKLYV